MQRNAGVPAFPTGWWIDNPAARGIGCIIRWPGSHPVDVRSSRGCGVRGEVDLAQADVVGNGHQGGGEVEDRPDAGGHEAVDGALGGCGRGGDDADEATRLLDDLREFVDVPDGDAGDPATDDDRVGVDDGCHREAAGSESVVAAEGLAEVSCADDDDGGRFAAAEDASDLLHEEADVVADAAGAVGAEVGEVLADLGGVDARQFCELLGRDGGGAVLGEFDQAPEVDGQADDGGLGKRAGGVRWGIVPGCHDSNLRAREAVHMVFWLWTPTTAAAAQDPLPNPLSRP